MLNGVGFTFTAADLATINGGTPITDGAHTLSLQATDSLGHESSAFTVSFTLQSTRPLPPTGVQLIASDLTGTSNTITKDRTLTVQLTAPAGTIVTLYMNGASVGQQTSASSTSPIQFVVPGYARRRAIPLHGDRRDGLRPGEPVLDAVHRHGGQHAPGDLIVRA